ncbi:hypothetical protein AX17_006848 [Amanita inopinata Kibby_2008]|nr:hypothetical protein AX17_006848 [Amanita inopinata Kibby_2008]
MGVLDTTTTDAATPTPTPASTSTSMSTIKAIDKTSIHRITSGQVVVDLQTAVKELVENSLDAGASSIEVRFKQYGVTSVEVVDNGCGIADEDWDTVGLKHYTSKLSAFEDLTTVRTFGFRGEALSSLCALCESVVVTTATKPPMGVQLELEQSGRVGKKTKVARKRGTTVMLTNLFAPLPVRRKELQRNAKREFSKALTLLNAYALGPCAGMDNPERGVRLSVSNQSDKGQKIAQIKTLGVPSFKASMTALWGPKVLENIVDLDLSFLVKREKTGLKRIRGALQLGNVTYNEDDDSIPVQVKGLISKFTIGCGRTGTDRQFFYVNGRPCNLTKVQKAFNEVYRTFNVNQAPFILADFIVPTECCDINVSPDKRTIFMQSEGNLINALKTALEDAFSPHRSTLDVNLTQQASQTQKTLDDTFSKTPAEPRKGGIMPARTLSESQSKSRDRNEGRLEAISTVSSQNKQVLAHKETATESSNSPSRPPVTSSSTLFLPDLDDIEIQRQPASAPPGNIHKILESNRLEDMDVDEARSAADDGQGGVGEDESVVIDTTRAIWNRPVGLTEVKNKEQKKDEPGSSREREDLEPVSKKRRVEETTEADDSEVAEAPNSKVEKLKLKDAGIVEKSKRVGGKSVGVSPLERLRSRLASFSSGKQAADSKVPEKGPPLVDEDEELDELESDDEEPERNLRPGPAERRKSAEVSRKANLHQESLHNQQTEVDKDVPMDEDRQVAKATVDVFSFLPSKDAELDEDDDDTPTMTYVRESAIHKETAVQRPEVIRTADAESDNVTLQVDLSRIRDTWKRPRKQVDSTKVTHEEALSTAEGKVSEAAGVSNTDDNESATLALSRVINKSDFAGMDVIGQFNLGFIVTRRRKMASSDASEEAMMDDLFIVDQHASDEKYNFETLQETTRIQSQKLFKPRHLELTAADELVAIENLDVLRQNGFEVEVDAGASSGQGQKLKLMTHPVSKGTVFDMAGAINLFRASEKRKTVFDGK